MAQTNNSCGIAVSYKEMLKTFKILHFYCFHSQLNKVKETQLN